MRSFLRFNGTTWKADRNAKGNLSEKEKADLSEPWQNGSFKWILW